MYCEVATVGIKHLLCLYALFVRVCVCVCVYVCVCVCLMDTLEQLMCIEFIRNRIYYYCFHSDMV